jgi:hypothetical protein
LPLSQIPSSGSYCPTTIHAAGEHLTHVLAHFRIDQLIQLGVHRRKQIAVLTMKVMTPALP